MCRIERRVMVIEYSIRKVEADAAIPLVVRVNRLSKAARLGQSRGTGMSNLELRLRL